MTDSVEVNPPETGNAHPLMQAKARVMEDLCRHVFRPAWWAPGAHAQTMWSPLFRPLPEVRPRKECWETPDGDFLNVHVHQGDPGRPVVLLLHGLEGSVRSNYMVGLTHAFAKLGWSVAAMEHRSCGGEMNRAKRLYHSGWTEDIEFAVGELIRRDSGARIFIAGYSLGGNQTAKWLGESGDSAPKNVVAAAVVSAPFDLTVSGPRMDRVAWGLYTKRFLRSLIPKAVEKERQYPGSMDIEAVKRSRTFEEFDTHATAALHGFRDAWDYWSRVACGQFLEGVRRPMLLVSSADDPFNPGSTLPHAIAERSPYLYPQFTRKGGHCGFVYGPSPKQSRHWAEEQVVRFFKAIEGEE